MVKRLVVLLLGCASLSCNAHYKKEQNKYTHKSVRSEVAHRSQYELDCLVNTAIREGENQTEKTQAGIMYVIHNRAKRNHESYCATVNKRNAFSHRRFNIRSKQKVIELARQVMGGSIMDPTNGALFFHDKSIRRNPFRHTSRTTKLGDMFFYKVVNDQYSV